MNDQLIVFVGAGPYRPAGVIRARLLFGALASVLATAFLLSLLAGCERDKDRERAAEKPTVADPSDDHSGHLHGTNGAGAEASDDAALPVDAWCFEHDVPEAVCTRCNPKLVAQFKETGDWCGGHGIPESQCLLCNPEFEAKWAAMRPKTEPAGDPGASSGVVVERWQSALRPVNDPHCNVEANQIRFLDRTIADKAGIRVELVTNRSMSAAVECPAEVRYAQTQLAHMTPRVPGVITEVAVDLGETVAVGDVLAVIDSAELGRAKSDYIAARESFLIAQADLERHHAIHEATEAMLAACAQHTTSDELRRLYADSRIGEEKGRLLTAHAQLELARQRYDREKSLAEKGIGTQESLQAARSDLDQAEGRFAATHEAIDLELEQEHLDFERALRVARVNLDASRRQLEIVGVSADQIAALDDGAAQALGRHELRSPIHGTIVNLHAVVGESITTDTPLCSIADLSSMWVVLSLQERDLATVEHGQPVLFTIDGLPGRQFQGTLDWISSEVDDRSRTVQARVTLPNPDGVLRANMFGAARVTVRGGEEVLAVPEAAVQTDGCCSLVFVRQSDTLYRPRKVMPGAQAGGYVEVLDGLKEGELLVTTGSFLMKTEILKGSIGAGCCEVEPGR